ncbi:hypothetical protein KAR52_03190 [Candidatus Pacearchaeota archaeon]|nr:hypothetical protein [Candidatus Pacearchaeota archaeon]
MLHKGMSKSEIETELGGKGDFVQIDYLTRFMDENMSFDLKKFVCFKLEEIYERKGMLNDAAKMLGNIALISIAFSEKIKYYVKAVELYIRAGFFDKADSSMRKALNQANEQQKQDIYSIVKNFYKQQAEIYEKEFKRNHAVKIYEKLLEININDFEREEIKKKLLDLYEKLGKFKEYSILQGHSKL